MKVYKNGSISRLSIEEQEELKKLEPFSMHMLIKPNEEVMKINLFTDFNNVSEINDAFNVFKSASSINSSNSTVPEAPSIGSTNPSTEVKYSFSDNKFSRYTRIIDQELFKKSLASLAGTELFLSGSTYTFKYHFPRRIKKVNVEGALSLIHI